ncbi:hypothetical protein PilKf_02129 [Pillotina sp. SPG140]
MVHILCYIRYRSQLRKIRPELMDKLERSLIEMIKEARATVEQRRKMLFITFNTDTVGVWIRVSTLLESFAALLNENIRELYTYSVVVVSDIPEQQYERLCYKTCNQQEEMHVWCDVHSYDALKAYCTFHKTWNISQDLNVYALAFSQVLPAVDCSLPFNENIRTTFNAKAGDRVLIHSSAMDEQVMLLHRLYTKEPIITLNLEHGLYAFADIYDNYISTVFKNNPLKEKLESLKAAVLSEWLRHEYSPSIRDYSDQCFRIILEQTASYIQPVLILTNIHKTDSQTKDMLLSLFSTLTVKNLFRIYGTVPDNFSDPVWDSFFSTHVNAQSSRPLLSEYTKIPQELVEIAYLIALLFQYFPASMVPELIATEGMSESVLNRSAVLLTVWGLYYSPEHMVVRSADFFHSIESLIGERTHIIEGIVQKKLLHCLSHKIIRPCYELVQTLYALSGSCPHSVIVSALYWDIQDGTYTAIQQALTDGSFECIVGVEHKDILNYVFYTLHSLTYSDEAAIKEIFNSDFPKDIEYTDYAVIALENYTAFYVGMREYEEALRIAKELIIYKHARSYRLFALAYMGKFRLSDVLDYASFAVEEALNEQSAERVFTLYYAAILFMLQGTLDRAEQCIIQAETNALTERLFNWVERIRFMHGRLYFELGRYREALDRYTTLKADHSALRCAERDAVIQAWIERTKMYMGTLHHIIKQPGEDGILFKLESAYFQGEYSQAVALAEELLARPQKNSFLYTERPDWSSGFSQYEELTVPHSMLQRRYASVYKALALCRLSTVTARDQAVAVIRSFIEEESFSDFDPHKHFYFYAYYRVLRESHRATESDSIRVLSQAFKYLQQRASSINDLTLQKNFLNYPYWNNALYRAAKEQRLV